MPSLPLVPELSVVVPAHNEEDNILPLVEEIRTALDGRVRYEIVYVDDGSADRTWERLREARSRFPGLRPLRHRACCGQSTAVLTGVRAARAPWVVTLDGDGQNDPADIPSFLAAMRDPERHPFLKLVNGHRRDRRDPWIKRLSSRVANAIRRRMLRDDTPDSGCGFKLFPREFFLELPYFDHMHRFLPALVRRHGGEILTLVVRHRPRLRGRSKYGIANRLWAGIVDLLGVCWLQRRSRLPALPPEEASA